MKARLEQIPKIEDITRKLKQLQDENDQLRSRMTAYLSAGATVSAAKEEKEAVILCQHQIPFENRKETKQTKSAQQTLKYNNYERCVTEFDDLEVVDGYNNNRYSKSIFRMDKSNRRCRFKSADNILVCYNNENNLDKIRKKNKTVFSTMDLVPNVRKNDQTEERPMINKSQSFDEISSGRKSFIKRPVTSLESLSEFSFLFIYIPENRTATFFLFHDLRSVYNIHKFTT